MPKSNPRSSTLSPLGLGCRSGAWRLGLGSGSGVWVWSLMSEVFFLARLDSFCSSPALKFDLRRPA